jgi:hypothetical protein
MPETATSDAATWKTIPSLIAVELLLQLSLSLFSTDFADGGAPILSKHWCVGNITKLTFGGPCGLQG